MHNPKPTVCFRLVTPPFTHPFDEKQPAKLRHSLIHKEHEALHVAIEVGQRIALAPRSVVVALVHNVQPKQIPVVDVTHENTFCVCVRACVCVCVCISG